MYVIELHGAEVRDKKWGTLTMHVGREVTIDCPRQAEAYLQSALGDPWLRAYLRTGNEIKAVWARDMVTGQIKYLARSQDYTGKWALPFVGSPNARIAVGLWRREASAYNTASAWAKHSLRDAVTAIMLDRGGIRFAWELTDGALKLIARGPSKPLSSRK